MQSRRTKIAKEVKRTTVTRSHSKTQQGSRCLLSDQLWMEFTKGNIHTNLPLQHPGASELWRLQRGKKKEKSPTGRYQETVESSRALAGSNAVSVRGRYQWESKRQSPVPRPRRPDTDLEKRETPKKPTPDKSPTSPPCPEHPCWPGATPQRKGGPGPGPAGVGGTQSAQARPIPALYTKA